jgi:nicotinamide riboside kinase
MAHLADTRGMKIALLGAESTGKTQLAGELAVQLRAAGKSVAVVPEVLREWCEREGRTPRPEEQMPIAQEQERRVDVAAQTAELVIADTTALMVAIYSAMLFEDGGLYRFALERQRGYDLTLVTGLDLPWVADGLQRDGPHVREPVDALVRKALATAGVDYRVVYGAGAERLASALAAIESLIPSARPAARAELRGAQAAPWNWSCDKCAEPECEHRLFTRLLRPTVPPGSPAAGRPAR